MLVGANDRPERMGDKMTLDEWRNVLIAVFAVYGAYSFFINVVDWFILLDSHHVCDCGDVHKLKKDNPK